MAPEQMLATNKVLKEEEGLIKHQMEWNIYTELVELFTNISF